MIVNIIDSRTNKYDTRCDTIFEPAAHDNSHALQKFPHSGTWHYTQQYKITIKQALAFGNSLDGDTTLFIYDFASNPGGPE